MKTILGSKLVKRDNVTEKEIMYVTRNLQEDIENINKTAAMLITSTNIIGYVESLGMDDREAVKEFVTKYNRQYNIDTYKKEAKELLNTIKKVFNVKEEETQESVNENNIVTNKVGFTTGEGLEEQKEMTDDEKTDALLELLNSNEVKQILNSKETILNFIPKLGDINDIDKVTKVIEDMDMKEIGAYIEIVKNSLTIKAIRKNILNNFSSKDIEKLKSILFPKEEEKQESVNENNIVTNKVGFTTGEGLEVSTKRKKRPNILQEMYGNKEQESSSNKPLINIEKLNEGASEMRENINKHKEEMITNPVDTNNGVIEVANDIETDKRYTCNLCHDPKCPRQIKEAKHTCINAGRKGSN